MPQMQSHLTNLTVRLAADAQAVDRAGRWWPRTIETLRAADAFGWAVPREFGGAELSALGQVKAYEAVARGSMTAALILTQHDGACQLIAGSGNESLKCAVLPECARGDRLATVGISQLTTSRRHGGAAMRAVPDGNGFRLNGVMPWVTSAPHCDLIVTGGMMDAGLQMLAALPRGREGIEIAAPMELAALQASATCEVGCRSVRVDRADMVRGPTEKALARRAPVKSLTVSATGIGLAGALIDAMTQQRDRTPASLLPMIEQLTGRYYPTRAAVYAAADRREDPDAEVPAVAIRGEVNDLMIRLAVAQLTLCKGSGMLLDHPAQRLAREAMFFLVWSAPEDVQAATLSHMLA